MEGQSRIKASTAQHSDGSSKHTEQMKTEWKERRRQEEEEEEEEEEGGSERPTILGICCRQCCCKGTKAKQIIVETNHFTAIVTWQQQPPSIPPPPPSPSRHFGFLIDENHILHIQINTPKTESHMQNRIIVYTIFGNPSNSDGLSHWLWLWQKVYSVVRYESEFP